MSNNKFPRGSEWRKWDLHVHTPFSCLNNGFGSNFDDYVINLFKKAIENEVEVIGITDYFCIEGYKKIKKDYLENKKKLQKLFNSSEIDKIKKILVLPNIEFRLNKLINEENRVNYHIIFSDKVSINDIEENFLHELEFVYEGNLLSSDEKHKLKLSNIENLGKKLKNEHNEFKSDTDLFIGMKCAVVDDSQISEILDNKKSKFEGNYLIFTPADEDLSKISWNGQNHNIRKVFIQKSNGLFTSNKNTINWGLGKYNNKVEDYIKEFKSIKPCIWGSDAHNFDKLFSPDNNKFCWIKADPTFEGLKQIIHEPEERVYIGERPEVLDRVKNNKTEYIKSLKIDQVDGYDEKNGVWFKKQEIEFNKELVAIIGNKGKGKSAIADILGYLGNSHINNEVDKKENYFSFLRDKRFLKKGYADNFEGTLSWEDGTDSKKKLSDVKIGKDNKVLEQEKVRYLPQNYFNNLTNELESKNFTEVLEKVIFEHLEDPLKLGQISFQELKDYRTKITNEKIKSIKLKIAEINKKIIKLEKQNQREFKEKIESKITEKEKELEVQNQLLKDLKVIKNPNEDENISEENKKRFGEIDEKNQEIKNIDNAIKETKIIKSKLEKDKQDLKDFLAYFDSIEKQISDYKEKNKNRYKELGLEVNEIIELKLNKTNVEKRGEKVEDELEKLKYKFTEKLSLDLEQNETITKKIGDESLVIKKEKLLEQIENIKKDLSKQEQEYQNYLEEKKKIENKIEEIKGEKKEEESYKFDTLEYYKNIKKYISKKEEEEKTGLEKELDVLYNERLNFSLEIYKYKKEIIELYEEIKKPIDQKIEENKSDINSENQVNINVNFFINQSFNENFLKFVNQGKRGSFSGKEEGVQKLKEIYKEKDLNNKENIKENIKEILNNFIEYLIKDKREGEENSDRIIFEQINEVENFYNYIFSLDYIDTEFELKSGKKSLNELSPGEKGTLLLMFYLMIDIETIPLIIDQPEDNLDNQSVFNMLSKFIRKAKKKRQIIIITHNPNLAIGADAEQIIYVDIDKEINNTFSFKSGSIENKEINNHTVDILEGTKKAFDKRGLKYIK